MDVRGILTQPRSRLILGGVVAALLMLTILFTVTTIAWAQSLADDDRLLPGTVVAGVDVGGQTVDAATETVSATLDDELQRTMRLVHGEREWTVTPRDLAASADASAAVRTALEESGSVGVVRLGAIRWLGAGANIVVDAAITAPVARLGVFTRQLSDEIDTDVRDAGIAWNGGDLELSESVAGLHVERAEAIDRLRAALGDGSTTVDLPVTETPPSVTTQRAASALPAIRSAVDAALDRTVTISHGGHEWAVSARDLSATPVLDEVLPGAYEAAASNGDAELSADHPLDADVLLSLDDEAVDGQIAEFASQTDVPARNASLDWSSGWVERIDGEDGLALDRERAAEDLVAALRGDTDTVELEVGPARPSITMEDYRYVLLVRQTERMVYLYVDGEITREWPVAVGTAGQPTPTGEFRVGAKRFEPTWHNPAPTGWGRNMPRVIGPGPDNPLGLRALNWNRNGHDTLIRFHGTPQEQSIGQAASAGCVRMFNRDVIEMFDLVPSGAAIVSIHEPNPRDIDHGQDDEGADDDSEPDEDEDEDDDPDDDPDDDSDDD